MAFGIDGMDEFQHRLKDISDRAQAIDGDNHIPLSELLTPDFLAEHTRFHSASELLESSGFKIESVEDFQAIPQEALDSFINQNSPFSTWHEMLQGAVVAWTRKKLGF